MSDNTIQIDFAQEILWLSGSHQTFLSGLSVIFLLVPDELDHLNKNVVQIYGR